MKTVTTISGTKYRLYGQYDEFAAARAAADHINRRGLPGSRYIACVRCYAEGCGVYVKIDEDVLPMIRKEFALIVRHTL